MDIFQIAILQDGVEILRREARIVLELSMVASSWSR
jgi:hypothetical protein